MSDPSQAYPGLVAADLGATLHNRGRNGPMVHQVADFVLGDNAGTWRAGTAGAVLVQAVSNTARDLGVDSLALTTIRNALRAMVATSRRRVASKTPTTATATTAPGTPSGCPAPPAAPCTSPRATTPTCSSGPWAVSTSSCAASAGRASRCGSATAP